MPAVPKSPTATSVAATPKKAGAPKAKGAVRAKSGCYTCRIRRKKCDERPNHLNSCETCVRLRLECLGFGAKRPDWLRESSKVSDLRDRIKTFLASQGMIKGHSGSGPRGADGEPPILRLNDQDYSSPSDSPRSGILTLSSSADDFRPLHHHTSAIRDQAWDRNSFPAPLHSNHSSSSPGPPPLRHSPPYSNYNSNPDMPYTFQPNNAPNSIVPWINPTVGSSFGSLYHTDIDMGPPEFMDDMAYPSVPFLAPDFLIEHYMKTVVDVQYLLADRNKFPSIIFSTVETGFSRDGARLLAEIHRIRSGNTGQPALLLEPVKEKYEALRELLRQPAFNDNDAMASLHVVSSFLFDGGQGEWEEWLNAACSYSRDILRRYPAGPKDALLACSDQQRFLIKTSIWFDVLASVTTLQPPRLLQTIRDLFAPDSSGVYDPSIPLPVELSMMPIMGCENIVVWALAETSALSAWKQTQEAKGCLSMPELVTKGLDIGHHLNSPLPHQLGFGIQDRVERWRHSTAELFRASTRIYLASVVSGDHPSIPEIAQSVHELMRCIERMPNDSEPVIRSTVFAFFICGCFTDNSTDRKSISQHLGSGDGAGNCSSVKQVLEDIWVSRKKKSDPVPWRKMLHARKLLLV